MGKCRKKYSGTVIEYGVGVETFPIGKYTFSYSVYCGIFGKNWPKCFVTVFGRKDVGYPVSPGGFKKKKKSLRSLHYKSVSETETESQG